MAEDCKPEVENNQNAVSRITTRLLASFSGTSSSDSPLNSTKPLKPGVNCWHCFLKTGRDSETASEGDFDTSADDLGVVITEKDGLVSTILLDETSKIVDQNQAGSENHRSDMIDGISAAEESLKSAHLAVEGERRIIREVNTENPSLPTNQESTSIVTSGMANLNEMARFTATEQQEHEPGTNLLPDIFQSADHVRPLPLPDVTPDSYCGFEGDPGRPVNYHHRHYNGEMNSTDQVVDNGSGSYRDEEGVDTVVLSVEEKADAPDLNGSERLSVDTRSQSESEVFSEMSTGTTDTDGYSTTNESDLDLERLEFGETNLNVDIPEQYKEYQGYADWNKFFQSIQQRRETDERETTPVGDDNSDDDIDAGVSKCSLCHRNVSETPMSSSEPGSELSSPEIELTDGQFSPLRVLPGEDKLVCNGCSDNISTNSKKPKSDLDNLCDFCFKDDACDTTSCDTTPTSSDLEQLVSNTDDAQTENMKDHKADVVDSTNGDREGESEGDAIPFHGGLVKVDELAGSHGQSHGRPKPPLLDIQAPSLDLGDTETKTDDHKDDEKDDQEKPDSPLDPAPFVPKLQIPDNSPLFEDREFNFVKADFRRSVSLKTNKTPPGTPHRKKEVRFADALGLDLESVRHIFNIEQPPMIPSSAIKGLSNTSPVNDPQFRVSQGSRHMSECFRQPGCEPDFYRRVNDKKVCLENTMVTDMTITGTIRVANIAYHKKVFIHYSTDNWATTQDIPASYVANSCDGPTDRFAFTISLPPDFTVGSRLKFAVCYNAGSQVFWDNNNGEDYMFECYFRALPASESDKQWLHFL
ncbi:dentin sialophosphoprotein [Lingula anatina]|uniref:Dentin sialophosphoprotein n=1 Tax=Lingula anatina TaxID=7574 RepID=A0A1S3J2H0_LINAN|nr:dentin sialophosphoprotein [Lingula anatina]|eukprot:XP_013404054.1 dentin sialophosphoprotein [Lingula anatina]